MSGRCAKQQTLAVLVKDLRIWVGRNDCETPQMECPRKDLETGVGYAMCRDICHQSSHAEIAACIAAGDNARDADLYLFGHSYICDHCMAYLIKAGVKSATVMAGDGHKFAMPLR